MNDTELENNLSVSTKLNGPPLFCNFVEYSTGNGAVIIKFFFIPASGGQDIVLLSTICMPSEVAVSLSTGITSQIKTLNAQIALQTQVNKPEKTKN